jgi:hypothetical protein
MKILRYLKRRLKRLPTPVKSDIFTKKAIRQAQRKLYVEYNVHESYLSEVLESVPRKL